MERRMDPLGRLVLPKEYLTAWGLESETRPWMCIDDYSTQL